MWRRVYLGLTGFSAATCVLFTLLWMISHAQEVSVNLTGIPPGASLGIGTLSGRLYFTAEGAAEPGVDLWLDSGPASSGTWDNMKGELSFAGFAVHHALGPGRWWWVGTVPLWLVVGLTALLFLHFRRLHRESRIPPGHCQRCGYDLRATPDRCPECGPVTAAP